MNGKDDPWPKADRLCWLDAGMVELSLLLPVKQLLALEQAAYVEGLTLGQFLRLLIRDALNAEAGSRPGEERPPRSRQ
jgi:hypothetical protein